MHNRTAAFRSLLSLHAESLIEGTHERLLSWYEVPLALYFEDNLCVLQSYAQLDAAFSRHVAKLREHGVYSLEPSILETGEQSPDGSRIPVLWRYRVRGTVTPRSTRAEYFTAWSARGPAIRMVAFHEIQPRSYRSAGRVAA